MGRHVGEASVVVCRRERSQRKSRPEGRRRGGQEGQADQAEDEEIPDPTSRSHDSTRGWQRVWRRYSIDAFESGKRGSRPRTPILLPAQDQAGLIGRHAVPC